MEASSSRQHHPHALPLTTDPPALEKHLGKAAYKKHEQLLVQKRQHPYPEVVASYHPLHKEDIQEKPQLKQQQKQPKQSPQLTFNPAVDNKQDLQAFLKGVVHRYEHWKTKEMNDPYSALARMAAAAAQAPALPVPPVAQHQQQPQQEEAAVPMAAPSAPIRMPASPPKGAARSEAPEVIVLDDDDDDEDDEEPATAVAALPAVLPPQQRKRKLPTAASTLAMPPPQKRKILGGVLKTASTSATASPASSNKKVSFCTSLVGDSADQATIMTEADVDVTTGTSRNVMLNKRLQMIRSTRVSLKRAKLVDVYKVDPELVAPPNETEDERRRRMERINGRRKRAKKLIELDHLNDQMMTYTERNTALKEENEMIRQKILVIKEAMKRANGNPHDDLVQAAARDALTMFVAAPTERLQMEEQAAAQQAQAQIQENFAAQQSNDHHQQAVELNPARGAATLQQQQQQQAAAMRRRALQQYQNRPQAPQQQQKQQMAQAQAPRSPQPQQQEQQPKQQKGPRRQPRVGLPDAIPDQRPRAMQQSRAERQKMQRAIMKAQAKRAAQQAAAAAAAQANGTANQNQQQQQDAPPFPGPGVARPMFPATGQTLPTTAQPQQGQQAGMPQQAMTMPNGMQMPAGMPICTQAIVLDKDGKPQPILMMMPNPAAGAANGANGANGGAAAPQQFFPMMAQGPNGMTMMMPQMMMGPNGTPMQAFVPMAMPGAMTTPATAGTATAPNAASRRSTEQASATSNKSRGRSRDRTATAAAGTASPRATSPFLPSNTARLSTTAAATTMDAPASPPQLPNLRLTVNNPTNVAASQAAAVDARTSFQQYTSNMQMRLARANATAAAMEPTTAAEPPVEDDSEESEEEQQHHLLRARAEAAASPAPSRSADPPGHQSDYLYPRREAERNLARSSGGNRAGAAVARGRPDAPEDPDSEGGDVQVLPGVGATAGVNNSMYRNTSNYASSGASVASQSSASYSASTATEEQKARKKKRKQIYPSLRNYRDSGSVSGSSVYSASSAYSSSSETEDSSRKKKKRGGVYPSLRNYKASSKSAAKKAPPTAATAGMAVPAQLLQKQGEDLKKMQQKQKLLKLQQKEQQRQQRKQQRRMQKKGRIAGAAPQPQNFQLAPAGMDMQGLAARDLTSALVATAAAACDGPEADEAFRKAMRSHGVSEFDDMPTDDLATANSILVQLQPPRGGSVSSSQGDKKPAAKGARGAVPVNNRAAAGRPRACDP